MSRGNSPAASARLASACRFRSGDKPARATSLFVRIALAVGLSALIAVGSARALQIEVLYDDEPGEGFQDPDLGAARRAAFEAAVEQWAAALAGEVPVVVAANMPRLGGGGVNALLGSAGAVTLHRNFPGGRGDTWYPASLANQLSGADVNGPEAPEIEISFNADVDGPEVLGSVDWYYGLDAQPGADIDFVTIALHEIGHGLGFLDTIDPTTGDFRLDDDPSILERMLVRPEIATLSDMLPPERLAAIIAPSDLLWSGPSVTAFNGSPLPVYSPEPFQQGSSIAHWDTGLPVPELIQPSYSEAIHDFGALLPALVDIGWALAGDPPTPRAPLATPTPTRRPRPTATAATPRVRRDKVYVTNFDDASVSVIDADDRRVVRTVPVDGGPIGIAASADGTRVYIAGFQAGTLSVLRTGDDRVIASIPAGESPNAVAVSPDGAFIAVTDTAADRVLLFAADTLEVVARVSGGRQPSGLALDGAGRLAFVSNFSGAAVTVVDLDARRRRAIIPLPFASASDGILGIAVAPATGRGYVAALYGSYAHPIRADSLFAAPTTFPFSNGARPEAVVTDAAGELAYFAGHERDTGRGRLSVLRMQDNEILSEIRVGQAPEALALASDEKLLYVANTGAGSLSVVDTTTRMVVGQVAVGRAPMGVAVSGVPEGLCPDDCATPTPTASPTPTVMLCDGDCDGDGRVRVDELVVAVAIASERMPMTECEAADSDGDGAVAITDLIRAVNAALRGCVS